MWYLTDQKPKTRQRSSNWPEVGPLGRDIDRVFSNLVYHDISSPVPLMVWCDSETIIILAKIYGLNLDEVDITIADQALLLNITSDMSDPKSEFKPPYTIPLLYQVAVSQIEADLDNNFLYIKLPRLKEDMLAEGAVEYLH